MNHTLQSLKKFSSHKQLFFRKTDRKILVANEIRDNEDHSVIYPILRTSLEVGKDIPFEQGKNDPLIAKSLWGIAAGAIPSKKSPTGYFSFDNRICITANQVKDELKKRNQDIVEIALPQLLNLYRTTRAYLGGLSEESFHEESIQKVGAACIDVDLAMQNIGG